MKQISLFFTVHVLREKSGVYILKVPQGDHQWSLKWRKDTKGEDPKEISPVYELHYSIYQFIKSINKIITSLFLQKSLEAYRNSEIQSNYKFLKRVSYNYQFSKNRSLKFDKIIITC